ncbi:hypothetical protein E4U55_003097 [Claviceps digitariae]|nr:hypothetical protein E4U55_003097 [Claviceps digitariae]
MSVLWAGQNGEVLMDIPNIEPARAGGREGTVDAICPRYHMSQCSIAVLRRYFTQPTCAG